MSFSGTIAQTVFNTRRVVDHAMRRCKMPAQTITAEHLDIAKDALYLLLSDLANGPVPLWCIQKTIYPLYEGISTIVTYEGTVDILNSNLRQLQAVEDDDAGVSAASWTVVFDSATALTSVGIKWSATAVPIALQYSDDGLTWDTIQTEAPSASAGDWTWYDFGDGRPTAQLRIVAVSGTLNAERIFVGNMPSEINLGVMNRDDYTVLPNKSFQNNRPLQFWLDRQALSPVLNLWPVPNASAETSQIVVWAHRHVMDVGTLAQEIEIPQRWYETIVAGLAAKLALEITEVDPQLIPMLDAKAGQAMARVLDEEEGGGPISILPQIGAYTR